MTRNTFIASEIRIEWAGAKLDQLESLIQGAINDALKAPVSKSSDDRMKVLLDLNYSVTPQARRLVSEYALHARAALDYIVFDLAPAQHQCRAEAYAVSYPALPRKVFMEARWNRHRSPQTFEARTGRTG
jgi:hypothetical protein